MLGRKKSNASKLHALPQLDGVFVTRLVLKFAKACAVCGQKFVVGDEVVGFKADRKPWAFACDDHVTTARELYVA